MDGEIRIGTVSSTDSETGMASVIYQDKGGEVTQMLPYATFNDEYKLPKIGAKVVVVHLSNGSEMGIILGTYWNKSNSAQNPGDYHKKLSDRAYFNYDNGELTIAAEHTFIESLDGAAGFQKFEVEALLREIDDIKKRLVEVEAKV